MSVRTLAIKAACSHEQNSAIITNYQALFERQKWLPAGNLRSNKADFSLELARLLDTRGSRLLIATVILQFLPTFHFMLNTPQKHGILAPGDKTGCFCPVATLLGILPQNISNRYRLLGSVRRLKTGSLGLFEKNTYYQIFLFEPTWAIQCDTVGAVVELSEQFFRESIHKSVLFITASILLVQT